MGLSFRAARWTEDASEETWRVVAIANVRPGGKTSDTWCGVMPAVFLFDVYIY